RGIRAHPRLVCRACSGCESADGRRGLRTRRPRRGRCPYRRRDPGPRSRRGAAMIRRFPRSIITLLCLLAIGLLPPCVNAEQSRTTLRVGLWTLWHDSSVKLTSEPGRSISLRTCAGCAAIAVAQAASIRAAGDALVLTAAGRESRASRVSIAAPVTLAAHGETLTVV